MIKVIKRDGVVVSFDKSKIINAVMKAQESVGVSSMTLAEAVVGQVQEILTVNEWREVKVATLQDLVIASLKANSEKVAHSYKDYREYRDKEREKDSRFIKEIRELISGEGLVKNENANKDAKVFPVQRDLMAGIISKHLGRNYALPDHIVQAHDSGDIHYHDLDYAPFLPMTNCCLVDLKGLLANGFKLGNAQIESPKSIGVACAVMAQITAQVASHQYGGTTFANVDQVLAEYAEKSWDKHYERAKEFNIFDRDKYANEMTSKEIYDGIQAYELI